MKQTFKNWDDFAKVGEFSKQIDVAELISESTKMRLALYDISRLINDNDIEAIRHKAIYSEFDNLLDNIMDKIRGLI